MHTAAMIVVMACQIVCGVAFLHPGTGLSTRAMSSLQAVGVGVPPCGAAPKHSKLQAWLDQAQDFGAMRFVVQGSGVILEAVGSVANIRSSVNPKTGDELITISEGNSFESHFRVNQIHQITYNEVEKFDKKLRINRFMADDGTTNLLSLILHVTEGEDATAREASWDASREKWDEVTLS